HGLDRASAREPLAARFYTHRHPVARGRHAVERTRELFARALGYPVPTEAGSYGLDRTRVLAGAGEAANVAVAADARPYLVFLHGTTWTTKHWPEAYWRRLIETAIAAGWPVRLPWGNEAERVRAERLAAGLADATVLPRLPLAGIAAQ